MAQVILSSVGQAVGGPIGQAIGSAIGRTLDQRAISSLEPARQKGPRLETLKVQGTAEGAPIPCVLGRARITGHVIWASRFLESRRTSRGGKGGPRTVEYGYSVSVAIALCEGPIDGVGRVWADGQPMDLTGVAMRLHRGEPDQVADPLIEAVEEIAPAYRDVAYVVFEDLALAPFGNRLPQLSFEVFRRPRGTEATLEDRLEGVCLIPGAGEFVLATEKVFRREGLTRTFAENVHSADGRTDLAASLDQLQAMAPNLKRASLVIGWFGDDLRASHCSIRPGVETSDKKTEPLEWSVAGADRAGARLVSRHGGGPAYGGTPSDDAVRQAVAELKARGLEVTLYPFVFMDIPAGNGLADPYGGAEQAAHPWRGRVIGRDGDDAEDDVAAIFGGADDWGLRRMILHYAGLAVETGADGLLIGSEMRGLTWTRAADGGFPAVEAFRRLAVECRSIVGSHVKLSYAADWSEYAGLRRGAEVLFHLDPLWAEEAIDYVGIDWYAPLGDWRSAGGGLDGDAFQGPEDRLYLASQVAGGDGFDWFYATPEDRAAQVRTPIADIEHGEHWVFRAKDLKGWWGNAHHDRPGGERASMPTAWRPGMKPVRLTEFGCPAVDRGSNAPNLFQDPKSAESDRPPFSTGERDDRMQRRALEAILKHYETVENNPVSPLYGAPMVEAADAWCWDARPWPAFPARAEAWADAGAWRTGHWLNGRLGGETRDLIATVLIRGGIEAEALEIGLIEGDVQGYVIDRPMRTRDALEPLLAATGLDAVERNGRIALLGRGPVDSELKTEALAVPDDGAPVVGERVLEALPAAVRVRFIDGNADYQTGSVTVRSTGEGGGVDLDLPAICSATLARTAAERILAGDALEQLRIHVGPLMALALEAGDRVAVEGREGAWRIVRTDLNEAPSVVLRPAPDRRPGEDVALPRAGDPASTVGAPFFRILELPPLPGAEEDSGPIAVVAADPWRPMDIHGGPDAVALTLRGTAEHSATVGSVVQALGPGVRHRWDFANVLVLRLEGGGLESRADGAVFAGANTVAVETSAGWELVQFRNAELQGDGSWRLTGLLRGQQGTEEAMEAGASPGAVVVVLDGDLTRVKWSKDEAGLPLLWRVAPRGAAPGGAASSERTFTAMNLFARPWRPAHLVAERRNDAGFDLSWIARRRIGGDRWEGEAPASDPSRFRLRVLNAGVEIRRVEIDSSAFSYSGSLFATDFPGGVGPSARVAVAQWGEGFGWGSEAIIPLV